MKKLLPRINITLSDSLRHEVKKAAKEAHLTESAFIREAIKSRLRNPPEDPLYWLQPEKEDFAISSTGKFLLLMVAQILAFADRKATPDERKLAGERAKKVVSDFLERERFRVANHDAAVTETADFPVSNRTKLPVLFCHYNRPFLAARH